MYRIDLLGETQQQTVVFEIHCVYVITGHNIEEIDLLHAIVYGYTDAIQNYVAHYIDLCNDRTHPVMMA